jgi:hypothetical protein
MNDLIAKGFITEIKILIARYGKISPPQSFINLFLTLF